MRRRIGLTALAFGLLAAPAGAQQAPPPMAFETFTLSNGLRFIVHEDHSTPIVALSTWYDVGSANEPVGRTGFAHFFEHITFQETENLAKGQMDEVVSSAGGFINGTTSQDRTAYYFILPSGQLNRGLWMEAERMAKLRVTQENFDREREVVKEERRMRIENTPYGEAIVSRDTLAFDWTPYDHIPIGTMDDLNAATTADVVAFYEQYYVPNNATIAVAGDVTVEEVKKLAEEYFGSIPRGPELAPLPAMPAVPRTGGERRMTIESPMANLPLIFSSYTIPPHAHDDTYALQLLANILGDGESSRLRKKLIQEEKVALDVGAIVDSRMGPGLMFLVGLPNQGVEVEQLESMLNAEVERVLREGVSARELQKAKNQQRSSMVFDRLKVFNKAEALQHARFFHGDIAAVDTDLQKYEAVTLDDIRAVARKYLTPENRSVVVTVPARPKAAGDAGTATLGAK